MLGFLLAANWFQFCSKNIEVISRARLSMRELKHYGSVLTNTLIIVCFGSGFKYQYVTKHQPKGDITNKYLILENGGIEQGNDCKHRNGSQNEGCPSLFRDSFIAGIDSSAANPVDFTHKRFEFTLYFFDVLIGLGLFIRVEFRIKFKGVQVVFSILALIVNVRRITSLHPDCMEIDKQSYDQSDSSRHNIKEWPRTVEHFNEHEFSELFISIVIINKSPRKGDYQKKYNSFKNFVSSCFHILSPIILAKHLHDYAVFLTNIQGGVLDDL